MDYDPFATTFSSSRQNHPWPELDAIIEDMGKHDTKSVLDIGCGNGRFLESYESGMMTDTIHYLGIDSSVGMIEEARRLHPDHHFEVIDMESIPSYPFSITPYDSILFLASFHHLSTQEQRIKTLQDTKKLLSSYGRIYMTNWNLRDQERYDTSKTGDSEYQIKIGAYTRYYHGFSLEELACLGEAAGLKTVEHRIFEGGRNIYSIFTA